VKVKSEYLIIPLALLVLGLTIWFTFIGSTEYKGQENFRDRIIRVEDGRLASPPFLTMVLENHGELSMSDKGIDPTSLKEGAVYDFVLSEWRTKRLISWSRHYFIIEKADLVENAPKDYKAPPSEADVLLPWFLAAIFILMAIFCALVWRWR